MANKALVTGASGFLGGHLAQSLLDKNWQVTCLLRPKSRIDHFDTKKIRLIRGDMDDLQLLEKSVEDQDYIFHLAARIRSTSRQNYDKSNVQLTSNLLKACLNRNMDLKRFVFVSSISAAGPSKRQGFATEDETPSPNSEYGRTKLKAEKAVQDAWNKIPSTIIRPPNIYGPRLPEVDQLLKLIKKRIVPLLKDRGKVTSLIYYQDLIEGILLAASSVNTNKQIYYLTDGKGYSWKEAILSFKQEILGRTFYIPLPESLIVFAAWKIDILKKLGLVKTHFGRRAWRAMAKTTWLFSTEKAKKDFQFKPRFSLEEGIRETADHYRRQGVL